MASGWYFFARARYACLISVAEAVGARPSVEKQSASEVASATDTPVRLEVYASVRVRSARIVDEYRLPLDSARLLGVGVAREGVTDRIPVCLGMGDSDLAGRLKNVVKAIAADATSAK